MKLIDKDKVISILQDKIAGIKLDMKCGFLEKRKGTEKILVLKHIISLINTLEVKEVEINLSPGKKKQLDALKDLLDYNIGVFDYQKIHGSLFTL